MARAPRLPLNPVISITASLPATKPALASLRARKVRIALPEPKVKVAAASLGNCLAVSTVAIAPEVRAVTLPSCRGAIGVVRGEGESMRSTPACSPTILSGVPLPSSASLRVLSRKVSLPEVPVSTSKPGVNTSVGGRSSLAMVPVTEVLEPRR